MEYPISIRKFKLNDGLHYTVLYALMCKPFLVENGIIGHSHDGQTYFYRTVS